MTPDAVFGGKPDRASVSGAGDGLRSPARKIRITSPTRPFLTKATEPERAAQHAHDDVLDVADVIGKRLIETRLKAKITIREENAIAALEVMSRFATDPKWLIYLPPTMSPSETSKHANLLEHPDEAFEYYRSEGVATVICEQKHMGSRAVVVLCKDESVSQRRFGVVQPSLGVIYTRTGRRFFNDTALEREFLARLAKAVERSGLWEELATDWLCLDCELMPWSDKAQELLKRQYAPVGNAAVKALEAERRVLAQAKDRMDGLDALHATACDRAAAVEGYVRAYRQYCWPVRSIDDLKLAPFHVLASEGTVHTGKPHTWHMETIDRLCVADPGLLLATPYRVVDLNDPQSCDDAVAWWTTMTSEGGEGMVVKPLEFIAESNRGIAEGKRGITQPAIKCRGPEYLRIIYGPEYLLPANLERLRSRAVGAKRSLASREFALGMEGLERFVRKEPLRLTHECVFGVLALESVPVDPRL